jgi:adsorption protein B
MDWVDVIAAALLALKLLFIFVSLVFLVCGLDDLFVDLCYYGLTLYRRWLVLPMHRPPTEQQLQDKPEQPIAIMLPAWDESAVIRPMLQRLLKTLNYGNYQIFVGTYPNDTATHLEVEKVRETSDRVQRICTPADGPTCKADCLNWIYQGIRRYEKDHDIRFEIFVMQDCEDVIHTLAYKMFNHLIPRNDMVQLPVFSLARKWHEFTGGHYLDEFAQLHYKDLVVRELLDHSIPAAGVGCAFSRRAFERAAASNRNELFNIDSLTEDYDFGFRMKALGMKQVFVKYSVVRQVARRHWLSGTARAVQTRDYVSVREYFPSTFGSAVRQKGRWVVGITLQGWSSLRWRGGLSTKYMLYRDRRALVTNFCNVLAYLVVLGVVSLWVVNVHFPQSLHYPPVLEKGTWMWNLTLTNAGLLAWRVFHRAFCVQRLYGWAQALLSIPRMVWGNFINFAATGRAVRLYVRFLRTGKLIAWDKTAHVFPSEEELPETKPSVSNPLYGHAPVTADLLGRSPALQGDVLVAQTNVPAHEELDPDLSAQQGIAPTLQHS